MTEACVAQPRGHLSKLRPRDARGFEDDSPRLHALEGVVLEHLMVVAFGIDEQQVHNGYSQLSPVYARYPHTAQGLLDAPYAVGVQMLA
eukprot:scaffold89389_cov69-Phaeocystis_antarctica.AAC.2